MSPSRKQLINCVFLLLVTVAGAAFSIERNVIVKAETTTFLTSLDTAPWRDPTGSYGTRTSYASAPFTIEDAGHSFIFSAGIDDATNGPRLGSQNASSLPYHDFDHASLAPFRSLTMNKHGALIAMATSLVKMKVTRFSLAWSGTYNGAQDIHYIYSIDDGNNWLSISTGSTSTGSPLVFETDVAGNRLRVGVLATYTTDSYRYIDKPVLSFDYEPMLPSEQAASLMDAVSRYSPCATDTMSLLQTSDSIAQSLQQQYLGLDPDAKSIFDNALMVDGHSYRARLDLILSKHGVTLGTAVAAEEIYDGAANIVFWIVLILGVSIYGLARRRFR